MESEEQYPDIDFSIRIDEQIFQASSLILCAKCKYFENENKTRSISNRELVIVSPFNTQAFMLLEWLHTTNTKKLLSYINSIDKLIEVYALSRLFGVKKSTNFRSILISVNICYMAFDITKNISTALCKELIDIYFLLALFKKAAPNLMIQERKLAILLEWLGEKNCQGPQDIDQLTKSSEFISMKSILAGENLALIHSPLLAKLYPIGIKSLN